MCGIVGFYGFEDKGLLKTMIKTLNHRGPDDSGYYIDDKVSLGHTRLSIIDLSSSGHQPLSNEDGSVWVTYNGEIYNYIKLRKNLEKLGHRFSSETDTEVIVHAYEEYGTGFLKKLRGMFAFAIWDSKNNIIILARDNIGKKPLYYYINGESIMFSSEIKAILKSGIEKKISNNALLSYLAFQYTTGNQTIFEGIKKLLPGHYLVFNGKREGSELKKYWDFKETNEIGNEAYYTKILENLLEESTNLMLRSDVPVGAFLSGGIDSSIIVAYARNKVDYDFHTFSMGFDSFSELEGARKTAEYVGTKHHEIVIDGNDTIKEFSKIAWHFDEPVGDAAIVANYFLSKKAKKYVKVVLAGEGGDELFAGYDNYKKNLRFRKWFNLTRTAREVPCFILKTLPEKENPWKNNIQRKFLFFNQRDFLHAHLHSTRGINDWEVKWLGKNPLSVYSNVIVPTNFKNPLNFMLAIDCKNQLPEKYLMKADKATMASGLEERLVLLDNKIINFAFSLPTELKIRNGIEKYILRKTGEGKLPPDRVWAKKQGFGVTFGSWIKNEMKEYILQSLEGEFIQREFRKDAIKNIIQKVKKGNVNGHQESIVWSLFALQEWYNQYFG